MGKLGLLLEDFGHYNYVVGLDEVGRGAGAGPVVTAAVIMPKGFKSELIRDSKFLSETQRKKAYNLILENAVEITCEAISAKIIDEVGINPATFKAMHKCLDGLNTNIDHILVDGTEWQDYKNIPATKVVKGDDKYTCIAAAAIVAKVRRDEYMDKIHKIHPQYYFDSNKGYLSQKHIEVIKKIGPCRYHREQYIKNFKINI
jgi:ribonuclease HII